VIRGYDYWILKNKTATESQFLANLRWCLTVYQVYQVLSQISLQKTSVGWTWWHPLALLTEIFRDATARFERNRRRFRAFKECWQRLAWHPDDFKVWYLMVPDSLGMPGYIYHHQMASYYREMLKVTSGWNGVPYFILFLDKSIWGSFCLHAWGWPMIFRTPLSLTVIRSVQF